MFLYNAQHQPNRIDSAAMDATSRDSLSDSLATAAVLLTTLLAKYTGVQIDGWCGVLVSVFVCVSGYGAAKGDASILCLDSGRIPALWSKCRRSCSAIRSRGSWDYHDLVVHNYGPGRVHADCSCGSTGRGGYDPDTQSD